MILACKAPADALLSWTINAEYTCCQGAFSLHGDFPPVEENVHLIKGLFSDSLPPLLRLQVCPLLMANTVFLCHSQAALSALPRTAVPLASCSQCFA